MSMNKQKGNMYGFVTHTWNPIRGECPHDCEYCYMKVFRVGHLRFEKKEMLTDLGKGNFIFVGSSTDMWAEKVPDWWIGEVLAHCQKYPENRYLFQTKNPRRFRTFITGLNTMDCILGITLETTYLKMSQNASKAPNATDRALTFSELPTTRKKMISIEPVMEFDKETMLAYVRMIKPEFVSVGADSQGHNLPEPMPQKIDAFLIEASKLTKVFVKGNLDRLLPGVKEGWYAHEELR